MAAQTNSVPIHPVMVRVTHWVNALATLVMLRSGWRIYDASPFLPFAFPVWTTLGGWLGGALLWHFAAMWLLVVNGCLYLGYGIATSRLSKKLLPLSVASLISELRATLALRLDHDDLSAYNSIQRLAYLTVIGLLMLAVLSGICVWKPVQFAALSGLMGGYQGTRVVHFAAMTGITGFLAIHVLMSLLVPRSIIAMLRGY